MSEEARRRKDGVCQKKTRTPPYDVGKKIRKKGFASKAAGPPGKPRPNPGEQVGLI